MFKSFFFICIDKGDITHVFFRSLPSVTTRKRPILPITTIGYNQKKAYSPGHFIGYNQKKSYSPGHYHPLQPEEGLFSRSLQSVPTKEALFGQTISDLLNFIKYRTRCNGKKYYRCKANLHEIYNFHRLTRLENHKLKCLVKIFCTKFNFCVERCNFKNKTKQVITFRVT